MVKPDGGESVGCVTYWFRSASRKSELELESFESSPLDVSQRMNEEESKTSSKTDWDRLRSMADGDIDTSDLPELSREIFQRAELRIPKGTMEVTVELDPEIVAWFRARGDDWQRRLNTALRLYVEAHRAYSEDKEKRGSA